MTEAVNGLATNSLGQALHGWNIERSLDAETPADRSAVVDLVAIEANDKTMNWLLVGKLREVWRRPKTHTIWLWKVSLVTMRVDLLKARSVHRSDLASSLRREISCLGAWTCLVSDHIHPSLV